MERTRLPRTLRPDPLAPIALPGPGRTPPTTRDAGGRLPQGRAARRPGTGRTRTSAGRPAGCSRTSTRWAKPPQPPAADTGRPGRPEAAETLSAGRSWVGGQQAEAPRTTCDRSQRSGADSPAHGVRRRRPGEPARARTAAGRPAGRSRTSTRWAKPPQPPAADAGRPGGPGPGRRDLRRQGTGTGRTGPGPEGDGTSTDRRAARRSAPGEPPGPGRRRGLRRRREAAGAGGPPPAIRPRCPGGAGPAEPRPPWTAGG